MLGPFQPDNRTESVIFLAPHPNLRIAGDEFADGVGGTIAATILMAETMAGQGWEVLVASTISRDVVNNGVRYAPVSSVD